MVFNFDEEERQIQIQHEDQELHQWIGSQPNQNFVAFDIMIQFIERCIEDGKDPTPFREAAIYIATGCSVDGKSNAPTASGSRYMPSIV